MNPKAKIKYRKMTAPKAFKVYRSKYEQWRYDEIGKGDTAATPFIEWLRIHHQVKVVLTAP